MPAYVALLKYTAQGIGNITDSPNRIQQAREAGERVGVKIIGVWVTMGEYDLVGIFEATDDQTMASYLLGLAGRGNITTQTMKAFSEEEFAQIVGRLP